MDATVFAHLRPKERSEEFAARVASFIGRCPEDTDDFNVRYRSGPYWQIVRACQCIDWGQDYRARWHNDADQYRVRTKLRRFEVRNIVYYLPLLDLYNNESLEGEREALLDEGHELLGIYEAIIKACTAPRKDIPPPVTK